MPTKTEIAWAAGYFEGEGCISFGNRQRTRLELRVSSTDRDVISKFALIVNDGAIYKKSDQRQQTKPAFVWSLTDLDAVAKVYAWFEPHLGERRRVRFEEVIETVREQRAVTGYVPRGRYGHKREFEIYT